MTPDLPSFVDLIWACHDLNSGLSSTSFKVSGASNKRPSKFWRVVESVAVGVWRARRVVHITAVIINPTVKTDIRVISYRWPDKQVIDTGQTLSEVLG